MVNHNNKKGKKVKSVQAEVQYNLFADATWPLFCQAMTFMFIF